MEFLIGITIFLIIVCICDFEAASLILPILGVVWFNYWILHRENVRMENKNPLDVDNSKMTRDICNGVSQSEIRRRYGNGYYDKDKK